MSTTASNILDQIETLRSRGEEFCVATVVRTADATSAKAGAKAVVTRDGTISGFVGGGCVQGSVRRAAVDVLASGKARLIRVKPKDTVTGAIDDDGTELHPSACPSGGTVELFIEPMLVAPRLIVLGASPVAAALLHLANAMGYRSLAACSESEREAVALSDQYTNGFDLGTAATQAIDAIVVATQGRGDFEALKAAFRTDAGYLAFVGSHRKAGKLKQDRATAGVDHRRLDTLRSPAGLDIGAIEPEEIALSIFAEIIQWRRSRVKPAAGTEQNNRS